MQDKPKGKNYSCNNAEGKRKESDFYETPFSITEQLLTNESFDKSTAVLEPACGAGAIVKVLQKHGFSVTHFDKETDFLKFAPPNQSSRWSRILLFLSRKSLFCTRSGSFRTSSRCFCRSVISTVRRDMMRFTVTKITRWPEFLCSPVTLCSETP